MPVPGLIDTYAFSDWMKVEYRKAGRPRLHIHPENGGLLTVLFFEQSTHPCHKYNSADSLDRAIAEAEEAP